MSPVRTSFQPPSSLSVFNIEVALVDWEPPRTWITRRFGRQIGASTERGVLYYHESARSNEDF